jgi:protein-S-isoprenylcysteine O-methyltransferase Ste14
MVKNTKPHRDLLRALGERLPPEAPATARTQTHLSQRSQNALAALIPALICAQIVFGVRSGLRHPRQLTAHVIASGTFTTVTYVLLAARAVQWRRPKIAAGRALSAAGSLARLRAASAEPLQ